MVYRSRGNDWGTFAKGFSEAFAAMMKLAEDKRYHEAIEEHWRRTDAAAHAGNPFLNGTTEWARWQAEHRPEYNSGPYGGSQPTRGEDAEMRDHIIQWSQEHGKNPAEALAIWRQESGGGTNMKGDGGSSFGDFQFHFGGMNPSMPHPGMGDDFLKATGIDMRTAYNDKDARFKAADFALDRAAKSGWGDWINSVKATGVPIRWSSADKTTTAKTEPTVDGKPAVTTIVEGKPSEPPAKVEKASDKVSQAGTRSEVQVASTDDAAGLAAFLDKHPEALHQPGYKDETGQPNSPVAPRRSTDSISTIPPNPVTFDPHKPQQVDQGPPLRDPRPNSAIPQGPEVPAQAARFTPPVEAGFPYDPYDGERGPEHAGSSTARDWRETDQPRLPPVQGRERGPELAGQRQWQEGDQPRLPPVQGRERGPELAGRQQIAMPARPSSLDPNPDPLPMYGPNPRADDGSRPDLTRRGGPMGPEQPGRTTLPVASAPGRTGSAEINVKLADGNRDERTTPDADKPAAGAIPASATAPTRQSNQPNNSDRFVTIERPNADPTQRDRGSPQGTALNLSSLWGPNPPVSQRGQAAAAPPVAAAPSRRDDEFAVSPPNMDDVMSGMAMGAAKGGAVRRYAQGGAIPAPTMKYAAAGGVVPYTTVGYQGGRTAGQQYYFSPDYVGPRSDGSWSGTPYDQLAPNQQAWADTMKPLVAQQGQIGKAAYGYHSAGGSGDPFAGSPVMPYSVMPTAVWPTAAPAAPAPVAQPAPTLGTTVEDTTVVDPTTTAGTGAPGIPSAPKAKSYDPNVDTKTGANFTNTNNAGGTNYTVDEKDTLKTNDDGDTISGYAQGGAIPMRPVMKMAGGGRADYGYNVSAAPPAANVRPVYPTYVSPTSTTYVPPGSQPSMGGPVFAGGAPNPSLKAFGNLGNGFWATQSGMPYQSPLTGAQVAANLKTMTPDQQAWYSQQVANKQNDQNWAFNPASYPTTPAAAAPAAPAAPTPAPAAPVTPTLTVNTPPPDPVDPSNTPGTGAPGIPDNPAPQQPTPTTTVDPPVVTPPVVDPTIDTVVNTPTNPVPKQAKTYDPTQDTSGKYASGSKNVGDQNYQRSVDPNSASSFGMYDYGQIQGFDDGGAVNPSSLGMPPGLAGGQQPTPPIYYSGATYAPAGAPVGKGVTQSSLPTQIGMAIPTLPMLQGGMVRRYADGGGVEDDVDVSTGMPNIDIEQGGRSGSNAYAGEAASPDAYATASSPQEAHPDLPAWTPQVNDGQGNPSRGLIGAIAGGLKYLASQLGLGEDSQRGAIAADPQTQANRRSFVQGNGVPGAPMPSHEEMSQMHQSLGLNDGLHEGLVNLATMEAARNFYDIHGDPEKAGRMAASMLQYSVTLSRDYGDQAVKRYYANDLNGSVHAMLKAKAAIADGTLMNAKVNQDANGNDVSVNIEGTDLNGKRLWAKTVGPEAILGAALRTADGSMAWHLYEAQAAKYDPELQRIAQERREDRRWQHQTDVTQDNWRHQQDVIDQKQAAKDAEAEKQAGLQAAVLKGMTQPRAPTITPVSTPPAIPTQATQPPRGSVGDSTGTAATAAPPVTADSEPGFGGAADVAGALPGPPQNPADIPSAGGQPVSEMAPAPLPPRPDEMPEYTQMDNARRVDSWRTYNAQVADIRAQKAAEYKQAHDDRQAELTRKSQEGIAERQLIGIKAAADRAEKAAADKLHLEQVQPMDPKELSATFRHLPDPDSGMEGTAPRDWYAASPHYATDAAGNPIAAKTAKQTFQKDFDDVDGKGGVGRVNTLDHMLYNTKGVNARTDPSELADLIAGGAKAVYKYDVSPAPIGMPEGEDPIQWAKAHPTGDGWGLRYAVNFSGDDFNQTIVMPESAINEMVRLTKFSKDKAAKMRQGTTMDAGAMPVDRGVNADNLMLPGIQ